VILQLKGLEVEHVFDRVFSIPTAAGGHDAEDQQSKLLVYYVSIERDGTLKLFFQFIHCNMLGLGMWSNLAR
jgi:hypothetical protein